jgi:perosamine synthetase
MSASPHAPPLSGSVAAEAGVPDFAPPWLRHQLPVYSPLPLRATLSSLDALLWPAADPRPALLGVLLSTYDATTGVLCGSGTQALRLALRVARQLAGGALRVALPAFSCFDVAAAAVAEGAEILLYDLDPATLAPDLDSLDNAFRHGARVVVAAPLYGIPLEWESLRTRCEAHDAVLVEDAAQGFGAAWRGRRLGGLGALSVLSFGRGKGWTGGRGGALLLRAEMAGAALPVPEVATLRTEASTLAVSAIQAALGRPALYRLPVSIPWLRLGETVYHDAAPPTWMPRSAAAMLLRTRVLAEREAASRRRHAAALLDSLRPSQAMLPVGTPPEAEPGYLRLPVRLARGMVGFPDSRAALRLGIAPSYPTPLAELPALRARLIEAVPWPGARELARTLVTLPTHSRLLDAERAQVLRMIDNYPGS